MRISDQVVMKLQALIEERHMRKGDRLPAERQLATSLGVSRPSLREAIQQLNSQGVLTSRRGDGTYIQQLPEQWPQQLIVNPISNLIEEDPLYRFDVQEARLLLEGVLRGMPHYAQHPKTAPKFIIILMKLVTIKMRVTQRRLRWRMLNSTWRLQKHRTMWC